MRRTILVLVGGLIVLGTGAEWLWQRTFETIVVTALFGFLAAVFGETVADMMSQLASNAVPLVVMFLGGGLIWAAARHHGPALSHSASTTREQRAISPAERPARRVKEWFSPWMAAEKFTQAWGDYDAARKSLAGFEKEIAIQQVAGQQEKANEARNQTFTIQRVVIPRVRNALARELIDKLANGELLARGFVSPATSASPHVAIPPAQWRVMGLDFENERGQGDNFEYVGLVIGKPRRWF